MKDPVNAILQWVDSAKSGPTVGVKANINAKRQYCHGGIKAYDGVKAERDALVIRRLRDAGYNISAIVNMEEGALGAQTDNPWFGKTHNPLRHGYTPGGSSGGSAAAVAAGLVDIALGTDTMGSVRIPSAYCGIWGFKPSHNVDMLDGVMPLAATLDTVGVHANTLDDAVKATEVICGQNFSDGTAGDIYVLDYAGHVDVEEDVDEYFQHIVKKLGSLPHTRLGKYAFGKSRRAGLIISETEGWAYHALMLAINPQGFSDFFRGMLEYGRDLPLERVEATYAHMAELRADTSLPDFILMPTAPQTAFKFGDPVPANQADFTAFANLANRPAMQFPIGEDADGLPIGAQLVGPRHREADLVVTMKRLWDALQS